MGNTTFQANEIHLFVFGADMITAITYGETEA